MGKNRRKRNPEPPVLLILFTPLPPSSLLRPLLCSVAFFYHLIPYTPLPRVIKERGRHAVTAKFREQKLKNLRRVSNNTVRSALHDAGLACNFTEGPPALVRYSFAPVCIRQVRNQRNEARGLDFPCNPQQ